MTRHLHEPANALLYRALDLPPEERQRFLAAACEGEPELLDLVRTLLARIDLLDEFLEAPTELALAAPTETRPAPPIVPQPDDSVGDWRVLRELGRDGSDAILLVERGEGAALQRATMRIAQGSGQAERFEQLRQRLSSLSHPAIARLLDAGVTADGRPYFAIEQRAGVPLDRYCADAKLDLDARVALVAQVCHAVHAVHQQLVIHGDLKPANIVVGADGAPAVLGFGVVGDAPAVFDFGVAGGAPAVFDFGVAGGAPAVRDLDIAGGAPAAFDVGVVGGAPAALDFGVVGEAPAVRDFGMAGGAPAAFDFGEAGEASAVREFGVAGGAPGASLPTPLFASPERLAGRLLGTGADVYSLGAVLYCLVSGRAPNAAGIIGPLAPAAPAKASDAVLEAAERQHPPLPELAADDLLRPGAELARQLIGELDDILLKATDPDPARRYASADAFAGELERFLLREAPQAAAASVELRSAKPQRHPIAVAVAALAACSLVAVTVAALWHARLADQAREVAEQRAGPIAVKHTSKKPTAAASPKLAAGAVPNQGQLAETRRRAGDLQGAQQAAALALDFAEKQLQASPDDARLRRAVSRAHGQLGAILVEQGRTEDGLVALRQALALREALAATNGGDDGAARDVADAHAALAAAMMAALDYTAAEQEFGLAHATYAAQLRAHPGEPSLRAGLIELSMARANVQNLQRHGRDAVSSLAALHKLADAAGGAPVDAHVAARIALLDAHIQPRGTPAKAYAAAERALAELLTQTEKEPLDTAQLRESALAWQQTGEIGLRAKHAESACRYLGLAAQRYDEFDAARRLNAIDKLRQGQVQALRKACG